MKSAILLIASGIIGGVPVVSLAAPGHGVIDGDDSGLLIGATIGQSKLHLSSDELGEGSTDETGFKLIGGYRVNPWLSFETAYFNPGQFSESEAGATLRLKTNIFQASIVGTAPVTEYVSVFVRAGAAYWDAELFGSDGEFEGTLKDSGTDFNWGFGVNLHATDQVNIRFEFDETKIDAPIGELPVEWRLRFLQVGVIYKF